MTDFRDAVITRGTPCALDHEHDPDRCTVVLTMTRREAVYLATGLKFGARALETTADDADEQVDAYKAPEQIAELADYATGARRRAAVCVATRRVLKRLLGFRG